MTPVLFLFRLIDDFFVDVCFGDPWLSASKKSDPTLNIDRATLAATLFLRHPKILGVELFGSIIKQPLGRDLDIILITDNDNANVWHDLCNKPTVRCCSQGHSRFRSAQKIFGRQILRDARRLIAPALLDIYVYSKDWRSQHVLTEEIRREAKCIE